ncbi:hypothetical protein LINPERHAP1_LOCUS8236 [Linum perenne]
MNVMKRALVAVLSALFSSSICSWSLIAITTESSIPRRKEIVDEIAGLGAAGTFPWLNQLSIWVGWSWRLRCCWWGGFQSDH